MGNPSDDQNTLKGFDMVLSLTEPAINQQLALLYETPVKSLPLPPPATTQPKTTYLINHRLELHSPLTDDSGKYKLNPDGTVKYSKGGIVGWIAPPQIKLNSRKDLSATVMLKFIQNPEPVSGEPVNSVYRRWVSSEDEDGHWAEQVLNNWTFSWNADLSSRNIQSTQELASLPETVHDTITGYVNNRDFTVASIFCLMNSVKITNTIQAMDDQNKPVTHGPFLTEFLNALIGWFDYELAANGVTPTNPQSVQKIPKNPFVLGYGISQNLPPQPGVPLFAPRKFIYSTTTSNNTDVGALNFCMVTKDTRDVDTNADGNAGNFVPSLAAQANINSLDMNNFEADGIMAISNGIFYDQYIVPYFKRTMGVIDFSDNVQKVNKDQKMVFNTSGKDGEHRRGPVYTKQTSWKLDVPAHDTMRKGLAIQERAFYTGDTNYSITWSSDPVPQGQHDNDVERRGYITIKSEAHVHYFAQTNTRGGADSLWAYMSQTDIKVSLRAVYDIHTTNQGKWSLEFNKAKSFLPDTIKDKDGNNTVEYTDSEPPANADTGIWAWGYAENYFGVFGGANQGDDLKQLVGWGADDIKNLTDSLNQIHDLLQYKIILPAGNVFFFKGINVDSQGNLLCPVTYQSISQGSQF